MIEVKVPRDILKYKTKLVGPFTSRQIICFVLAVMLDLLFYNTVYTGLDLPSELLFYIIMFLDLPIMAFGYLTPMELSLEKYLKIVIQTKLLAPAKRKNVRRFKEKDMTEEKKIKKSKQFKAYR